MMRKNNNRKGITLVVALVLLVLVSVGGTVAYLVTSAGPVTNTFDPGEAKVDIDEDFDDKITKSNVKVKNTCDIPVYVRVALTATWLNAESDLPVGESASLSNLKVDWGALNTDWIEGEDGYYYYIKPLAVGAETSNLIDTATATAKDGYKLELEIMAQCIQAEGTDKDGQHPVVLAWGKAKGGSVKSGGNLANLTIEAK